jgi:hypothetical protein
MKNSIRNLGVIIAATAFATFIAPKASAEEEHITVRRYGAFGAGYEVTHTFTEKGWVYKDSPFNYQDSYGNWHQGVGRTKVWGEYVTKQYTTNCVDWPNSAAALPANAIKLFGNTLSGIGNVLTPGQGDCNERRQLGYIGGIGTDYQNNSQEEFQKWQRQPQRTYGREQSQQQPRTYDTIRAEQIPFGGNRHPDNSLPPAPEIPQEPKREVEPTPKPAPVPEGQKTPYDPQDKWTYQNTSRRVMSLGDLPPTSQGQYEIRQASNQR